MLKSASRNARRPSSRPVKTREMEPEIRAALQSTSGTSASALNDHAA
jgi:hypothetical protein